MCGPCEARGSVEQLYCSLLMAGAKAFSLPEDGFTDITQERDRILEALRECECDEGEESIRFSEDLETHSVNCKCVVHVAIGEGLIK